MRHLQLLLLFGGCLAGTLDSNSRPAVTPMLSELPADPNKRDAVLDQANDTNGPEGRRTASKKQRRAETTAAFAAAIIGQMFSKTQNVTLGTATTVDENHLFEKPRPQHRATGSGAGSGSDAGSGSVAPTEEPGAGELTPWIKLK